MKKYTDIWACHDCYSVYHEGLSAYDPPEYWDIDTFTDFFDRNLFENVTDNSDGDEGVITFSKSSCDICRSHLAGSRYRFALWETSSRV